MFFIMALSFPKEYRAIIPDSLEKGKAEKTDTLTDLTQVETGLSDGTLVELCTSFPEGTTFYYRYADSIEYRFER